MVNQFGPGPGPGPMPPPGANPEPVSPYEYSTAQTDDQTLAGHYLIALKDHTIYAVVAYWIDGDTLHYFTSGNVHNQASLSLVDRDLTARLNKESGQTVDIPAAK
jgi:endonuclease YncB( thermonuclease family)